MKNVQFVAALLLMFVTVSPAYSATMESITNSTVSAGDRQDDPGLSRIRSPLCPSEPERAQCGEGDAGLGAFSLASADWTVGQRGRCGSLRRAGS